MQAGRLVALRQRVEVVEGPVEVLELWPFEPGHGGGVVAAPGQKKVARGAEAGQIRCRLGAHRAIVDQASTSLRMLW